MFQDVGLILSSPSQLHGQISAIMSSRSRPSPSDGVWLLFALASSAPNPLSLRALALFLLFALAAVGLGESLLGFRGIERSPVIEGVILDGSANGTNGSALAIVEILLPCSGFPVLLQQRRH